MQRPQLLLGSAEAGNNTLRNFLRGRPCPEVDLNTSLISKLRISIGSPTGIHHLPNEDASAQLVEGARQGRQHKIVMQCRDYDTCASLLSLHRGIEF